jgi:MFS family permease
MGDPAQLTVLLDNTVLSVAIPSLTLEPDASTADIKWMINAYSLVQSGLLLTVGNAADRYGRKRMLIAGLALFGAGSLAAGLAESSSQLIAARAGVGGDGALPDGRRRAAAARARHSRGHRHRDDPGGRRTAGRDAAAAGGEGRLTQGGGIAS